MTFQSLWDWKVTQYLCICSGCAGRFGPRSHFFFVKWTFKSPREQNKGRQKENKLCCRHRTQGRPLPYLLPTYHCTTATVLLFYHSILFWQFSVFFVLGRSFVENLCVTTSCLKLWRALCFWVFVCESEFLLLSELFFVSKFLFVAEFLFLRIQDSFCLFLR